MLVFCRLGPCLLREYAKLAKIAIERRIVQKIAPFSTTIMETSIFVIAAKVKNKAGV